jgi:hypothetical protein
MIALANKEPGKEGSCARIVRICFPEDIRNWNGLPLRSKGNWSGNNLKIEKAFFYVDSAPNPPPASEDACASDTCAKRIIDPLRDASSLFMRSMYPERRNGLVNDKRAN